MRVYEVSKPKELKSYLKALGVESGGISIIAKKMELLFIKIEQLRAPAANILKQDALSVGAELAVPGGVILCEKEHYDCLLIGTKRQLEHLSRKELAQPFGLKKVALAIKSLLHPKVFDTKIMGVLNINSDSFYSKSRFDTKGSIEAIEQMIADGADIIDIGAVSSRPGAVSVSADEELGRLQGVFETIQSSGLCERVDFSIDSYAPKVVERALQSGFTIINDITGASSIEIITLAKEYRAKLCIMHMQGTPQTMQNNPSYESVTAEVDAFFASRIEKCEKFGVSKEQIILDVGIGFGKSLEHNIELLKNHHHFTRFGCELLIGASRKSMIDKIIPCSVSKRLPGTLAIHLKALERGASIVRCHDVAQHKQAIAVWSAIR